MAKRLAIIGAGILGLAHAWAAARRGWAVRVFERDAVAVGASVRNFGLGLLLGQPEGELLELARASRERWLSLLPQLGVWHKAAGAWVVARDAAEWAVLEAFHAAHGRVYGTALRGADRLEGLAGVGALVSPHEIGLDPRATLPAFAAWLAERERVALHFGVQVQAVEPPRLHTSAGEFEADAVILCAGHDVQTLFPAAFAPLGLRQCALQMLRLAAPGRVIAPSLMTGLSTLHYRAFTDSPALAAPLRRLRERVAKREPDLLAQGIHLIVQQLGAGGELVVGDSHHHAATASPFASAEVEARLIALTAGLLGRAPPVVERWQGVYASGPQPYVRLAPAPGVTAVVISSGIGMSICHALAEQTLAALP